MPVHGSGPGKSRAERFLDHLDRLSGGLEPRFDLISSTHPGLAGVTAITYLNQPEPGLLTAFTYGISLADHPDWRYGKAELCLSVRSADLGWPLAMARVAEQLRGSCPFAYGETINLGEPFTTESAMSAFAIFAPAVLEREDFLNVDVGDELPVQIAGCYPVHEAELRFIQKRGLEAFWKLEWDLYDVRRPSVVSEP